MRSAFAAPKSHLRPSGAMARRAANHQQKKTLMSYPHQPNCKHKAHWIDIPKTGPGWRIRRRIQYPSDCHIRDTPALSCGTGWSIGWRVHHPSNQQMNIISIFLHPAQIPVMWGCLPHGLAPLHCTWWSGYCHPRIWWKPMYPTSSARYTCPIGQLAK